MKQVTLLNNLHIRTAPDVNIGAIIMDGADANGNFHAGRVFAVAELVDRPGGRDEQWARLDGLMYYRGAPVPAFVAVRIGAQTFSKVTDTTDAPSTDNAALNQALDYRIAELRAVIAGLEKMKR